MESTTRALRALVARARASRHRGVLLLRGPTPSRAGLADALRHAELADVTEVGGEGELALDDARELLGAERDAIVLDLRARLDPAALGAVHGAVRAGGVLVVRAPARGWPGRFGARATRILEAYERVPSAPPQLPPAPALPEGTAEQRAAVEELVRMIEDAEPDPIVLVADRGRGKSAALGMAAAHALSRGLDVRVVSARRASTESLDRFARENARLAGVPERTIERRMRHVRERAAVEPDDGTVWLVDEAAALPVRVLRALSEAPRVAFATTVHGYEGTGRGFTERFLGTLRRERPRARVLRLCEPIRFAAGDPLERLVFELLLLDAAPAQDVEVIDASARDVTHSVVDRDALDEPALRELFGLLVAAHYRTTPRDLAMLLDAPHVELHALFHRGRPVAAAMLAAEGGLAPSAIDALMHGRARPAGHALPETLIAHCRRAEAGRLRGLRVLRLAVHPALRRRALGRTLIEAAARHACARGLDWIGALFGATRELLAFWMRAGFSPVRLSVSRGSSSGEHSAAVLRPCSPAAGVLARALRAAFAEDLPHQLGDPLRELDPDIAIDALRGAPGRSVRLSDREIEQLVASAFGGLPYGVGVRATFELVAASVYAPADGLDDEMRRALVLKVLQRREWEDVAASLGAETVPDAMRAVRTALKRLVLAHGGERAARLARAYAR